MIRRLIRWLLDGPLWHRWPNVDVPKPEGLSEPTKRRLLAVGIASAQNKGALRWPTRRAREL